MSFEELLARYPAPWRVAPFCSACPGAWWTVAAANGAVVATALTRGAAEALATWPTVTTALRAADTLFVDTLVAALIPDPESAAARERTIATRRQIGDALALVDGQPPDRASAFTCPRCGRVSHYPQDIAHQSCGCCGSADDTLPKRCPHRESAGGGRTEEGT